MKDGDVYRWSYTAAFAAKAGGWGLAHWCKSQIAIVHDGRLLDTFWMGHGGKRRGSYGPKYNEGRAIGAENIELHFLANINYLIEIYPEDKRFYAPSDVVDLRHSNNSNAPVMVKKSAERSREVTRDLLLREIDKAASEVNAAAIRKERLEQELRALDAGAEPDEVQA